MPEVVPANTQAAAQCWPMSFVRDGGAKYEFKTSVGKSGDSFTGMRRRGAAAVDEAGDPPVSASPVACTSDGRPRVGLGAQRLLARAIALVWQEKGARVLWMATRAFHQCHSPTSMLSTAIS